MGLGTLLLLDSSQAGYQIHLPGKDDSRAFVQVERVTGEHILAWLCLPASLSPCSPV